MFESLGLGGEAENVYLHLVQQGPATRPQLARQLDRPLSDLVEPLQELRRLGLLYLTAGQDEPIVAVPLTIGVDHLISQRELELRRLRSSTDQLVAHLQDHAAVSPSAQVEVISACEDVTQHISRLHSTAQDRLRLLVCEPDDATPLLHETLDRHGSRGLTYQLVYDECSFTDAGIVTALSARLGDRVETRMAGRLPIKLTLADHTAVLVPLDAGATARAVLIRAGALLEAMNALFESLWRLATPLTLSGDADCGALDDQDHALMSLLVAGFTDDAAGARLGMSRRTVARRVQRLMNAAGARSRLQLGWWARERRWL